MSLPYDLDSLRPLSIHAPDVRILDVTVAAEPGVVSRLAHTRTAEVLMVLQRPDGNILLVRRAMYPDGIHRLPTGGVDPGETPQAAACREMREESGYVVTDPRLLGVVNYTMHWPGTANLPYVSYIFVGSVPPEKPPCPQDPEEVAGFRWIAPDALGSLAEQLRGLDADWACWGRFRSVAYDFIQCGIMQYNRDVG